MVRHRAFLPALLALVVALFLTAPRSERLGIPRDKEAEARLREVWSPKRDLDVRRLRARATEIGEPASRALFEILRAHYATANTDEWASPDNDEEREPEGILIGELATEETARAFARVVADRSVPWGARRALVVALSRPRFAFAADALARIACDRGEPPDMRRAVLLRFHRLGCRVPASLRDLLYQPYDGLDSAAAAALAMCGEPEAPSLIVECLAKPGNRDWSFQLCVDAAHRIVRRPLDLPRGAWSVKRTSLPDGMREVGSTSTSTANLVAPLVEALEEWMAAHGDSAFEQERLAYLRSDRRKREMALRTFEEIAAADDFDLAAASLWLTSESEAEVGVALERLHRLCLLCERRLAGAKDAEERIAVLNGLLASFGRWTRDNASHLPLLLAEDVGNCLARSTLYLAVAQRLGLPLRAYSVPRHIYVAWEEDGRRRNIEPTDAGKERPNGGTAVSPRQVLSLQLSNKAWALHEADAFAEAMLHADQALALDPTNPAAYSARARATWHTDLGADPRPDLDRGIEIEPDDADDWIMSSEMAWRLGFAADALRRAETAERIAPSPDGAAMQARAHLALGNVARAREIADEAARRWPNSGGALAFVRFGMALDREGYAPLDRTDIPVLWKARALLERASPSRALAQLDTMRDLVKEREVGVSDGGAIHVQEDKRRCREFHLLEARALAALDRVEEARAALAAAEEAAPPVRETLEVRRLLDGR